MGSKTPVSILQELCVQRGITPIYTLIYDGGGTHDCYFKYRVHVADFVSVVNSAVVEKSNADEAIFVPSHLHVVISGLMMASRCHLLLRFVVHGTVGSGHSKKEAKHEAAKIALERIKETRTVTDSSTEILLDAPLEQVASPYEGNLHENAVGRLQEICMANNMPLAEYVMVSEEGPPHDKWFVFRCSVSKLAEISGARTKKQAKHLAAFKMVQTLQESLGSSLKDPLSQQGSSKEVALPDDKDTPMSENISKYGEVPGQYYKKVPVSQKISMLYLSLQGYTTESLTKLKEKFDTGDTDDYASLKLLFDQTLDELSVTSEWFDLPRECLVETPRLSEELNSRQSELEINGDQISGEFDPQLEIIVDKIREELDLQFSRLEIDSDHNK
uniref:(California timema) hypothetical protein n=1 Tax=Timema californicum TaxID=61474 RepID=A0A7R9J738_TIMCA|nr:unnamed protein product [Timema californicum]